MPQFDPYLMFDGNCAEAMRFYEQTLGGKIGAMMKYNQMPGGADAPGCDEATASPENGDRIMHASLTVEGRLLMASDTMVGLPYEGMKGISVSLDYPTAEKAHQIFNALAEGGQILMPIEETFWAGAFGALVDRFGTPWMVNGAPKQMG